MERLKPKDGSSLDRVLAALRVQSTIFCRSELSAPWGFAVKARDASVFHVVLSGSCWLELETTRAQLELAAGDLVVLPTGSGHSVRDAPSSPVRWLDDLLGGESFAGTLRHGGDGPVTELLCGGFVVSGQEANPVLAALPDVVYVSAEKSWLRPTVELLRDELAEASPGLDTVVARLTDVLLVQAVRSTIETGGSGGLNALTDPEVARALALVHERPEHPWTVGEVAASVALSRSAFAGRFRERVGEPPMRYVRRCRLTRAAELLRTTSASLAEVAARSGYQSDVALSKAFKRAFAVAPGRYRRGASEPALVGG